MVFSARAPLLRGPRLMTQQWRHLTFVHWAVDPDRVAPLLPRGTRPDVLDGVTYVGLIPFVMVDAGLGRGPGIPWLGTFAETNVRLYSVDDQGRHGVVFRSLETTRLAVALGARAAFATPYTWASMSVKVTPSTVRYETRRRWPGPRGAGGRMDVAVGERLPEPGPVAEFVTARFGLHTRWAGRTLWIPNHHVPWPLHEARLDHLDDGLVAAAGLPGVVDEEPDLVLHSPGVETEFGLPRRAA